MHGKSLKNLSKFMPADLQASLHRALGQVASLYPVWSRVATGELGSRSRPIGYRAGVLTVQVDSPAWATVLRQRQRSLITELRELEDFKGLQEIRLKVTPRERPIGPAGYQGRQAALVSDDASAAISRTASSIEDKELKAALERLHDTTRNKQKP